MSVERRADEPFYGNVLFENAEQAADFAPYLSYLKSLKYYPADEDYEGARPFLVTDYGTWGDKQSTFIRNVRDSKVHVGNMAQYARGKKRIV